MKKRLLFIAESMDVGGAGKSLLNLLKNIDYGEYAADLFLFSRAGLLLPALPPQVKLIECGDYSLFSLSPLKSISAFLKKGNFKLALCRAAFSLTMKLPIGNGLRRGQLAWRFLKPALSFGEYDAAIGSLEGNPLFAAAECVNAKTKIGFIHSDYRRLGTSAKKDSAFFKKLDYIVTVSQECKAALAECFPNESGKIRVIENIISPEEILHLSQLEAEALPSARLKIATCARLSPEKGIDTAIEAAKELNKNGMDFVWLWVGDGSARTEAERKIRRADLSEKFILLGEKVNPYPYISHCDIYAQPSRFEGKSIAITEAKILGKPVVSTSFATASEQMTDGENGVIAANSGRAVAERIMYLYNNKALQAEIKHNLSKESYGNEGEIKKFLTLL